MRDKADAAGADTARNVRSVNAATGRVRGARRHGIPAKETLPCGCQFGVVGNPGDVDCARHAKERELESLPGETEDYEE